MKARAILTLLCGLLSVFVFAQQPVANFTSDITGGCAPIVVNFKDLSTGNPTAWQWDFGNGATSSKKDPSATYFNTGTYTVKLTVTNTAGTHTVTKTAYITVFIEPRAEFVALKRTGCTPAIIQFQDRTTTPTGTKVTGWRWDFGDGNSSTEQNPKHIYRTPGSFTVTLTITNDKGCTRLITKPNYIDIIQGVVPSFSYVDPGVCSAPATVTFTNNSSGPGTVSYSWDLGNGVKTSTTNPTTKYTTNGKYRVSLIVSSSMGCTDSTVQEVPIGKANTDFIVPDKICPKVPVQFLNNSNPRPIEALWQFSNGTTDTLKNGMNSFPAPGEYEVTLINKYNVCTDTLKKKVTVATVPTLDFKASDSGRCQPSLTVNFANTSTGTTYQWNFGDGSTGTGATPSHTYTQFGEFDVTLIGAGANGCSDTLVKPKYIRIRKPEIKFPDLPTQGCIPYDFKFRADITSMDEVTSYKWEFGDGGTSLEKTPTYTYKDSGTYNVSLTITTKGGCTETYTLQKAVKVGPQPKAAFTTDTREACAYPGVQFRNQSERATEYKWTFSDGTMSTEKEPLHPFNNIGPISVTLTAINNGCEDQVTKKDLVIIKPSVSRFDYQPNCDIRTQFSFTDKSIQAESYSWDFGNGNTSTAANPPAQNYPGPGSYDVKLTTTNGQCTYTLTRTIKIEDNTPDFEATTTAACKPAYFTFKSSSPNAKAIKSWEWNFGDGTTATTITNQTDHIYYQPGINTVTLTTIDTFGCRDTRSKPITRVSGPKAGFTSMSNAGCKGMTTSFIDTSRTDGVNKIVNWTWDYGDNTVRQDYTAGPFQHTYDSIGDYDVKLIVTDASGCKDSAVLREFVKVSTLKAKWEVHTQSCPDKGTWFGNLTTSDFNFTSVWDFGNGQTSTDHQTWYTYKDTGYYSIKLKVTDQYGCTDSLAAQDYVHIALPKASFDANNLTSYCTPFPLELTNTSYFYSSSYWELGQGTSTQTNPISYYTNTGVYPLKLTVTSPGGCTDTVLDTLRVFNPQDAVMKYAPLLGCRPLKVGFEAASEMTARFIWDFADGNVIDTTINKITHIYDDPGAFQPRMILKQKECPDLAVMGQEWVKIMGAKPKFGLPQRLFCDSGYLTILDSTASRDQDPITSYTWDFGDGTVSNSPVPPRHFYSGPGLYNISLAVATESGCKDTMTMRPGAKVVQSPLIHVGGDSVICVNERAVHLGVFDRPDTSAVRWIWQLPNGTNPAQQNPAPQQYAPGNYTVTTIATNSSGCRDTATQNITVNPLPVVTLPASLTKVVGVPVTLPATYSSGVVSYLWSPSPTLDCATCPQPVANPKFTTDYKVAVVDSNGCKNTGEIRVIVVCKGATVFLPNTFSPNGDGTNDILYVRGVGLDRVKSLRVFNRWGEVVFEQRDFPTNNPAYGWNGTYKGRKASPDVYVYQVEVFCENSEIIRWDGNVALIQ